MQASQQSLSPGAVFNAPLRECPLEQRRCSKRNPRLSNFHAEFTSGGATRRLGFSLTCFPHNTTSRKAKQRR